MLKALFRLIAPLAPLYGPLSRVPGIGFRAEREYERLRALHRETKALLADPAACTFETRPEVSGWSPAQHFDHVAQINQSVLRWLHAQCNGGGGGAAPEGDEDSTLGAPNIVGCVLLLAGRMPRGQARTPSQFAPPERPARAEVEGLTHAPIRASLGAPRARRGGGRRGRERGAAGGPRSVPAPPFQPEGAAQAPAHGPPRRARVAALCAPAHAAPSAHRTRDREW